VSRLPPGSLATLSKDGIDIEDIFTHNFERYQQLETPTVSDLHTFFMQGCKNRCSDEFDTLISLSGGMDSRGVAAGIAEIDPDAQAVSFVTGEGASVRDAELAKQISEKLDIAWKPFDVSGGANYRQQLLQMEFGMNSLEMAPLIEYAERVAEEYNSPFLLTGNGGDKIFPDLTPSRSFDSLSELARWAVSENSRLDSQIVEQITDVSREELVSSVKERLDEYPEESFTQKYVHFLIRERGFNWLNHGEERYRNLIWTDTPFYAPKLFRNAMAIPPKEKKSGSLYVNILEKMSNNVLSVPDAMFNAPPKSFQFKAKRQIYEVLDAHPLIKQIILKMVKDNSQTATTTIPRSIEREVRDVITHQQMPGLTSAMQIYTLKLLSDCTNERFGK
ncbi:asparagine synthase-related protein, partial [Haloferax profundi]|uniref:asparagine synthase-related protein n=1 Tax=Haloferax profundi TaxID=1544718 RepID=UPI000A63CCD4